MLANKSYSYLCLFMFKSMLALILSVNIYLKHGQSIEEINISSIHILKPKLGELKINAYGKHSH